MLVAKVLMLVGLVKLLLVTEKVFLCAGIYAGLALAFGAAIEGASWSLLGFAGPAFLLAAVYFWLLHRLQGSIRLFLLVLVVGLPIGLV